MEFTHNQHMAQGCNASPFFLTMGYNLQAIPTIVPPTNVSAVEEHLDNLQQAQQKAKTAHKLAQQQMAEQIIKDFTYSDFIYMVPKLNVKLREAIFNSQLQHSSNMKAQASGYHHSYLHTHNIVSCKQTQYHITSVYGIESVANHDRFTALVRYDIIFGLRKSATAILTVSACTLWLLAY